MTRLVRPKIDSQTAPSRHGFHNRDSPIRNPVVAAQPSDRAPTPSCPARPSSRPSRSHLDRADRALFPPALAVAPAARESGVADKSAVRHRCSRPVVAPDRPPLRVDLHRPGVDKLASLRSPVSNTAMANESFFTDCPQWKCKSCDRWIPFVQRRTERIYIPTIFQSCK